MRKPWLAIAFMLTLLGGYLAGRAQLRTVEAAPAPRLVVVPKAWGDFKGVYYDQLLFEDNTGTIRSVYPNGSSVVFTVTRR